MWEYDPARCTILNTKKTRRLDVWLWRSQTASGTCWVREAFYGRRYQGSDFIERSMAVLLYLYTIYLHNI
jgi:hypothetical protein